MKNNYKLLSDILRNTRMRRGYSISLVARKANISHTELSRIENRERKNYNLITLIKLCEILELDFIRLLKIADYIPRKKNEFPDFIVEVIDNYNKLLENEGKHPNEVCIIQFI